MTERTTHATNGAEFATPRLGTRGIIAGIAGVIVLHLVVLAITPYGVHRDEFLYLAMGKHLHFWRMDFPPLISVLADVSRWIFGSDLASVRVLPALEGAVLLGVTALMTREFGGGAFAQILAMLALLAAPLVLRASTLFQPVILDQLWWTLALYAIVRMERSGESAWWLAVGAALGLGLLTKFTIAFIALGLVVAALATPRRAALATRWPWLAAVVALALGSASIVGQIRLGFPVRAQMHDLQSSQLVHVSWWSFLVDQPMLVGPTTCLLAAAGLVALLISERFARFRGVGIACATALLLLLLLHGKSYYLGPVYPTLVAAGVASVDGLRPAMLRTAVCWAASILILASGVIAAPLALPLLPPEATARYARRLGLAQAVTTNRGRVDQLPQDFADMLGWEEQARALRAAVDMLTQSERDSAVVIGGNYGEAGAAEFYGARYRLPPVVSTAGSFWFFGPGYRSGRVAITIGQSPAWVARWYADVRCPVRATSPWSVSEERDVAVCIGREPRATLTELWRAEQPGP